MTEFEKELVRFVSGYLDAGVSAEDYVKAFSQRLLNSIGQQSKPKVSEDLETEALRSAGVLLSEHFEDEDDDAIRTTALRCWKGGFIAGANWQKEQMVFALKNDGDLPVEFIDKFHEIDRTAFQNGQANMKVQLMKEAVEGKVCGIYGNWVESEFLETPIGEEGDKVRIIICKKED